MTSLHSESVHGHEVMHLIEKSGPISKLDLSNKISQLYGNAKFHTCSASDMDLNQLLQFLLGRGKISEGTLGFFMESHQHTCEH